MNSELAIRMHMYISMKEDETKEEATARFYTLMQSIMTADATISFQAYEFEEQEA